MAFVQDSVYVLHYVYWFMSCFSLVSFCYEKTLTKATCGEEKVYFDLRGYSTLLREAISEAQRGNQKAGTEAENMRKRCLLICSQVLIHLAFTCSPGIIVMEC